MKGKIALLLLTFGLTACAQPRIQEGVWVDADTEKNRLEIRANKGRYWLIQHGLEGEIQFEKKQAYMDFRGQRVRITINTEGNRLEYLNTAYLPLAQSRKGLFTGHWKSTSGPEEFIISIDDNTDLVWEIRSPLVNPVRFWPKPTPNGFYFTRDQEEFSFTITDGVLLDTSGNTYKRISG